MPAESLPASACATLCWTPPCTRLRRISVSVDHPRRSTSGSCVRCTSQPGARCVASFVIKSRCEVCKWGVTPLLPVTAVTDPLTQTHLLGHQKHTLRLEPDPALEEGDEDMQAPAPPSLLVFSGGTAFNSVAGMTVAMQSERFSLPVQPTHALNKRVREVQDIRAPRRHQQLAHDTGTLQSFTTRVAHVLPVSDDGGSTAEIVRVLGGPAVGDIRSRCLRLADDSNTEVPIPCCYNTSNTYFDYCKRDVQGLHVYACRLPAHSLLLDLHGTTRANCSVTWKMPSLTSSSHGLQADLHDIFRGRPYGNCWHIG